MYIEGWQNMLPKICCFVIRIILSYSCCRWELGSSTRSQEKHFRDPHVGDCAMAWFICVETEAAPWVSNVLSPFVLLWKKSSRLLSKAKTKSQCSEFLLHIKVQPGPASLVCVSGSSPLQAPSWSPNVILHGHESWQVGQQG